MSLPGAAPPKPIPLKERAALIFVERARLDVKDGAFVAIDAHGNRTHIPIGGVACLMLEPGARISHAAVSLAARAGTLVVWIGEAGVRLYAAGQPGDVDLAAAEVRLRTLKRRRAQLTRSRCPMTWSASSSRACEFESSASESLIDIFKEL